MPARHVEPRSCPRVGPVCRTGLWRQRQRHGGEVLLGGQYPRSPARQAGPTSGTYFFPPRPLVAPPTGTYNRVALIDTLFLRRHSHVGATQIAQVLRTSGNGRRGPDGTGLAGRTAGSGGRSRQDRRLAEAHSRQRRLLRLDAAAGRAVPGGQEQPGVGEAHGHARGEDGAGRLRPGGRQARQRARPDQSRLGESRGQEAAGPGRRHGLARGLPLRRRQLRRDPRIAAATHGHDALGTDDDGRLGPRRADGRRPHDGHAGPLHALRERRPDQSARHARGLQAEEPGRGQGIHGETRRAGRHGLAESGTAAAVARLHQADQGRGARVSRPLARRQHDPLGRVAPGADAGSRGRKGRFRQGARAAEEDDAGRGPRRARRVSARGHRLDDRLRGPAGLGQTAHRPARVQAPGQVRRPQAHLDRLREQGDEGPGHDEQEGHRRPARRGQGTAGPCAAAGGLEGPHRQGRGRRWPRTSRR